MSSRCDPRDAPIGDVGTALLFVDSKLQGFRDGARVPDAEEQKLVEQVLRSYDAKAAGEVIDGACTLVYVFMQWLRQVHEANGHDVIEYVVPYVVGTLKNMPRSVRREGIPTMAGMMIAAAIDESPSLWRKQYGPWTEEEMTALEATAFLLAHYINDLTKDESFATRMVMDVLTSAEESETEESGAEDDDTPPV